LRCQKLPKRIIAGEKSGSENEVRNIYENEGKYLVRFASLAKEKIRIS